MTDATHTQPPLPGASLDIAKMPGHWLLARLGKRVLRPGGLELTDRLLGALRIGTTDDVVELAPGLGTTARRALAARPASYTGIERDEDAAAIVRRVLNRPETRCQTGTAMDTGLAPASASVVFGEAMLTMQTAGRKRDILREAYRVLAPGGRYGIHELGLASDERKDEIERELSSAIRVGARPLTRTEWRTLLEDAGFVTEWQAEAPMHLLEPRRVLADEGIVGTMRILANLLRSGAARRRVLSMRAVFRRYEADLCAIAFVVRKPINANETPA